MGKGWNIFLGVLGVIMALVAFIIALFIGLTAINYELVSFIVLVIFCLLLLISAIYSFKDKKWAKLGVIISTVVVLITIYNLFSIVIDLFFA